MEQVRKTANFSEDGKHRFMLSRTWAGVDDSNHLVVIGLNPSTADGTDDDPTIRRVMRFAKDNGYDGIIMLNLFSTVSTDPDGATLESTRVNEDELGDWATSTNDVLFAWGGHKSAAKRQEEVIRMFPNAMCLGRTASGAPKHPLYLKASTPMEPFR